MKRFLKQSVSLSWVYLESPRGGFIIIQFPGPHCTLQSGVIFFLFQEGGFSFSYFFYLYFAVKFSALTLCSRSILIHSNFFSCPQKTEHTTEECRESRYRGSLYARNLRILIRTPKKKNYKACYGHNPHFSFAQYVLQNTHISVVQKKEKFKMLATQMIPHNMTEISIVIFFL